MVQTVHTMAAERMPPKLDDKSDTERVQIVAPKSWLARVSGWRRMQDPIPNVSAAIRRLVEIGLEAEEQRQSKQGGSSS